MREEWRVFNFEPLFYKQNITMVVEACQVPISNHLDYLNFFIVFLPLELSSSPVIQYTFLTDILELVMLPTEHYTYYIFYYLSRNASN